MLLFAGNQRLKLFSLYKICVCVVVMLCFANRASAQYRVKGMVFDSSRRYVIEGVTVNSTGGKVTLSDSLGRYNIDVDKKDSIWFSYLGKPTPKYPVLKMADINQFDISLRIRSSVLQEVTVKTRSYISDSLQNRRNYAKIFNYQKVSVGSMTSIGPTGAGVDLDELIRLFQFRKNRSTQRFQQRLIQEERDKFVDRRFNKTLVKTLTKLEGTALDQFMQRYRPSYEFAATAGDYDFRLYIKSAFEVYYAPKGF